MIWPAFLQALSAHTSVDFVGPFAKNWQPSSRPVLFIDSGANWQKPCDLSATVGDGDSTHIPMDAKLNPDKDYSDFAFALRSLPQNIQEIFTYGFGGGRLDHQLANFGEAQAFLKSRLRPTRLLWDESAIHWSAGPWTFEHHGIFSLMAFENTHVKIEGECRYRLAGPMEFTPLSSIGLSNVAHGRVEVETDQPLLLTLES